MSDRFLMRSFGLSSKEAQLVTVAEELNPKAPLFARQVERETRPPREELASRERTPS